jgi:hypothetical protein
MKTSVVAASSSSRVVLIEEGTVACSHCRLVEAAAGPSKSDSGSSTFQRHLVMGCSRFMTASSSYYKGLPCVEFDRDGGRCELPSGHLNTAGEARHRTTHSGRTVEWITGTKRPSPVRD